MTKITYKAFRQQNLHRFLVKYPFLNKSQINLKVRQVWVNVVKNYAEEQKGYDFIGNNLHFHHKEIYYKSNRLIKSISILDHENILLNSFLQEKKIFNNTHKLTCTKVLTKVSTKTCSDFKKITDKQVIDSKKVLNEEVIDSKKVLNEEDIDLKEKNKFSIDTGFLTGMFSSKTTLQQNGFSNGRSLVCHGGKGLSFCSLFDENDDIFS
ncbi:uncharacterized protein LOC105843358 [Hydra vulgaris]|uniref:uncharacterized protein LOC105843358 n=1 Tax=Hydra vulgaris TaxID=6087 RepID=UPI0006410984|nr:uncharacterized protein LOC105843358 [Hydra vulgaris]